MLHVAIGGRQVEVFQDDVVEPFFGEGERHLVDGLDVARRNDRFLVDVTEERDLLLDVLRQPPVRPAEEDVGLDADRSQVANAVLRGLGLQLARRSDVGHQGEVDEQRVLAPEVLAELADGLEERLALDVSHRAADLDHDHVHVVGHAPDALLDLVGDVRNHLDRAAEVITPPLLLDDRQVDLAGCPVVIARGLRVREAFVVAQVEVGFGPVVGDIHLAVLVRAHRARVDVDVGIELHQRHFVPVTFEQAADRGGRQPLSQGRHDAAGDEYVLDPL